jgi:hypothetical protein
MATIWRCLLLERICSCPSPRVFGCRDGLLSGNALARNILQLHISCDYLADVAQYLGLGFLKGRGPTIAIGFTSFWLETAPRCRTRRSAAGHKRHSALAVAVRLCVSTTRPPVKKYRSISA